MERKTGKSGERENLIWDVMDERRMKRKEKIPLRSFNNQMYAPMLSSLRYRISEKVLALLYSFQWGCPSFYFSLGSE